MRWKCWTTYETLKISVSSDKFISCSFWSPKNSYNLFSIYCISIRKYMNDTTMLLQVYNSKNKNPSKVTIEESSWVDTCKTTW
jgi:hypothetical protein